MRAIFHLKLSWVRAAALASGLFLARSYPAEPARSMLASARFAFKISLAARQCLESRLKHHGIHDYATLPHTIQQNGIEIETHHLGRGITHQVPDSHHRVTQRLDIHRRLTAHALEQRGDSQPMKRRHRLFPRKRWKQKRGVAKNLDIFAAIANGHHRTKHAVTM